MPIYIFHRIASFKGLQKSLFMLLLAMFCMTWGLSAQSFHKDKHKYYKSVYKKGNSSVAKACTIVKKNKKSGKNRHVQTVASRKSKPKPMAEVGPPVATASTKNTPAIAPKPVPKITTTKPTFSPTAAVPKKLLDDLHEKEDKVLELNHLPKPTSEKHEEIRRLVSNTINKKTDNEPIELEPLYFTFDQDEFSVVDMDPFLIAVEFALQGKHILIEGHTDHEGNDNYNVQLSIKRVQKIRQLMLDMGVHDDQISVVGYGEEVTDHTNKTEEGKQLNRRVDFKAF
ncbi:MAG: OmpA family protein [Cytophagia bacterium]|nr:OmpA family protein [Cytophagia bacterium]